MNKKTLASRITQHMLKYDLFSKWLGLKCIEISEGHCVLQMKVRKEMLNGFGILHGGITFSLADSALAFAANAHGVQALSVHNNIDYIEPCCEGDELLAIASEESCTTKFARYRVAIHGKEGRIIALFFGMVYRTSELWEDKMK